MTNNFTDFTDIFSEYFSLFRGQADSIPVFPDREYKLGIRLASAAIKKWERADGMLWRELMPTLSDAKAIAAALPTPIVIINTMTGSSVAAPYNMRKWPAQVVFTKTDGSTKRIKTSSPQFAGSDDVLWFSGGANTGYTMHIAANLVAELAGSTFEYVYYQKATLPTTATDPAAMVFEMSDPTYIIQDMIATRFIASRNGFGFKTATKVAETALANMKIENGSGVYGNNDEVATDSGWGMSGDSFGSMEL